MEQEAALDFDDAPVQPRAKAAKAGIWTTPFVLIALVNLTVFMGFNMTTTGMPVLVASLGGSPFQVGLVTTLATGAALLMRPFTGAAVDRFGRKAILLIGLAVMIVAIALFMVLPPVSVILVLRFVQGIGWGFGSTATSTIVADVLPPARFAEGMGYFALTSSVATAIAPALSIALLDSAGPQTMLTVTLVCVAIAFLLALAGRFHVTPSPTSAGDTASSSGSGRSPLPSSQGPARAAQKRSLSSLFERRALVPSALVFLTSMGFTPITTFIVLHSQQVGVEGISLYFVVYALVNIVTRPVIGKLIDRHGFFWPALLAAAGVVATLALVAFSDSLLLFCVAGAFAGLGFGTAMGVLQTMAVSSVTPDRRGAATSTYLFGLDGGMAAGSLIAGFVAAPLGYGGMFLAMALFPLAAALVVAIMGRARLAAWRAA